LNPAPSWRLVSEICAALDDSARAAEFEDLVKRI
jgi:hypothetical protein